MMNKIDYPYLPEGRSFRFVSEDDPFMHAAKDAQRTESGDSIWPIGIALVKDGEVVATAGNGYHRGSSGHARHICPRIVREVPSGTGYDLCDLHDTDGHAEAMLMEEAARLGVDPSGADVYMYGHWWCCQPCWNKMIEAGVRDVYLPEGAHELFARDRVLGETLKPRVRSVFLAGAYKEGALEKARWFYESIRGMCRELGIEQCFVGLTDIPGDHPKPDELYAWSQQMIPKSDVLLFEASEPTTGGGGELVMAEKAGVPIVLFSKEGSVLSHFALGNPAVVYHVEYEHVEQAARRLQQVLKMM